MNLTKIHDNLWIDLSDIYLIDYDDYNDQLNVYIDKHVKIPIVIKGQENIGNFKRILEEFYCDQEAISTRCEPKNDQKAS